MNTPSAQALRRAVGDDYVDRRQVEAWQHVEPSRTNRPSGLTGSSPIMSHQHTNTPSHFPRALASPHSTSVVIGRERPRISLLWGRSNRVPG